MANPDQNRRRGDDSDKNLDRKTYNYLQPGPMADP